MRKEVDELCAKTTDAAEQWTSVADLLWDERLSKKKEEAGMSMEV